jgi:hypothetical protein
MGLVQPACSWHGSARLSLTQSSCSCRLCAPRGVRESARAGLAVCPGCSAGPRPARPHRSCIDPFGCRHDRGYARFGEWSREYSHTRRDVSCNPRGHSRPRQRASVSEHRRPLSTGDPQPGTNRWIYPDVALSNLPAFLHVTVTLSPMNVIACVGVVYLFRSRRTVPARTVLLAAATALGFFAYSYFVQYARGVGLAIPALVPGFHFLFYLRAFEAIAFGIGVVWLGRLSAHLIGRMMPAWRPSFVQTTASAIVFVALAVAVGSTYNAYRLRSDFIDERANARRVFSASELRAMYQWIVTSTNRSDVFIAPYNVGLNVVATAGRKVVALGCGLLKSLRELGTAGPRPRRDDPVA